MLRGISPSVTFGDSWINQRKPRTLVGVGTFCCLNVESSCLYLTGEVGLTPGEAGGRDNGGWVIFEELYRNGSGRSMIVSMVVQIKNVKAKLSKPSSGRKVAWRSHDGRRARKAAVYGDASLEKFKFGK